MPQDVDDIYPSAIATPPTKENSKIFLNHTVPSVPKDVTGVWHLWFIFFKSKRFFIFSTAMQILNRICPKRLNA
jgi:hypothetical protein